MLNARSFTWVFVANSLDDCNIQDIAEIAAALVRHVADIGRWIFSPCLECDRSLVPINNEEGRLRSF
jgi:hypothetical protein